jgi:hypothetical protein
MAQGEMIVKHKSVLPKKNLQQEAERWNPPLAYRFAR